MKGSPPANQQLPEDALPILLTGATGYIGSQLLGALVHRRLPVRCLARRPERLRDRVATQAEVVAGDVLEADSLERALAGTRAAYYLIHAMGEPGSFEETDRTAARNFARAARAAGLERILYLGGLAREDSDLSAHMRSRHEVGEILRESGVPVVELRASIILGAGSLSFELMRALVERLPAMITPKWVSTPCQPIYIDDVLEYLVGALSIPLPTSLTFEIGGADIVSFGDLMRIYGELRGLERPMLPVPLLTPGLSGVWLELVTPEYARIGRSLVDSGEHPSVVQDRAAKDAFPIHPIGVREAVARALRVEDQRFRETPTARLLEEEPAHPGRAGARIGSRYVALDEVTVTGTPEATFAVVSSLGGEVGWFGTDFWWGARAALDRVLGGKGLRRGRTNQSGAHEGDLIDFWRIETVEPGRRLRLAAEMKIPGRAWLEFEVAPADGGSVIRQSTTFEPHGLKGITYWHLLYPLHQVVFRRLLRGIAEAAG